MVRSVVNRWLAIRTAPLVRSHVQKLVGDKGNEFANPIVRAALREDLVVEHFAFEVANVRKTTQGTALRKIQVDTT